MKVLEFFLNLLKQFFILVILSGAVLVLFGHKIAAHNATSTKATVQRLDQEQLSTIKTEANYDWAQVTDANFISSLNSKLNSSNTPRIALLTQPGAKVATTVVAGLDNQDLNLAVGTISATQELGKKNFVLVGHHIPQSDWALLSGIYYYAEPGQKVYITDLDKVYEYEITNVRFVEETDVYITNEDRYLERVENIVPGQPMITLISCDVSGDKRITEYGTLTNVYDFDKDEIPTEAIEGFEKAGDFKW